MDLYVCDFAICDVGMKIVIWSGIEDRENNSFIFFCFCFLIKYRPIWNYWYPKLTFHSIHSDSSRAINSYKCDEMIS